jgi:hypothetical protein
MILLRPTLLLLIGGCVAPLGAQGVETYGPGMAAESLANLRIGADHDYSHAFRFRAIHGGPLESFRAYWIFNKGGRGGYHEGNGGDIRVQLREDDGTPSHLPTERTLATVRLAHALEGLGRGGNMEALTFPKPLPVLKAGQLYHLVFENLSKDRKTNYLSVNTLIQREVGKPLQYRYQDDVWGALIRVGQGPWHPTGEGSAVYTPILEIRYANGLSEGCGYMEVWVRNPKPMKTPAQVSERFTPTASRSLLEVSLRAKQVESGGPLEAWVEEDGHVLGRASLKPADPGLAPKKAVWFSGSFGSPIKIEAQHTYRVVFTSSKGHYEAFPIRKGVGYGFGPDTLFAEGWAEYDSGDGKGWRGWEMWDPQPTQEADLQFFFRSIPKENKPHRNGR